MTNLSWFSSWVRSVLTGFAVERVRTGGMVVLGRKGAVVGKNEELSVKERLISNPGAPTWKDGVARA